MFALGLSKRGVGNMNPMTIARGVYVVSKELWIALSIHVGFDKIQNLQNPSSRLLFGLLALLVVLCILARIAMGQLGRRSCARSKDLKPVRRNDDEMQSFTMSIGFDWKKGNTRRSWRSVFESVSQQDETLNSTDAAVARTREMAVTIPAKSVALVETARKVE